MCLSRLQLNLLQHGTSIGASGVGRAKVLPSEDLAGQGASLGSRHTDDRDGPFSQGGGDGCDGVLGRHAGEGSVQPSSELGDETFILLGGAHRYPHPFGQLVSSHGANDDSLFHEIAE